jgi:hypothetical protein
MFTRSYAGSSYTSNVLQTSFDSNVSVGGFDVHVVAAELDGVDGHWFNRRHAKCASGSNIEAGTMAGTLNLAAGQFPLGKRATVVRADIVNRVKAAINIEDGNGTAVDFDELFAPRRELVTRCDFHR